MTREDIEKAAGDYSGSSLGFTDNNSVMAKHKAFADGAEWRINSMWNDANKIPDKAELTLVEFPDGRIDIVYFHTIKSWRSMVKRNGTIRWAYIKDLIPNTEE